MIKCGLVSVLFVCSAVIKHKSETSYLQYRENRLNKVKELYVEFSQTGNLEKLKEMQQEIEKDA